MGGGVESPPPMLKHEAWEAESRQQCEMYDEVFKFVNSFKIKITTSLESRRVNVFFSLARTALT